MEVLIAILIFLGVLTTDESQSMTHNQINSLTEQNDSDVQSIINDWDMNESN